MARHGFPMPRGGVQDSPRARRLSSAKASRHGARAKGFAPRRNAPLGEGLPTRREGEKICPAREHAPRRRPPDTAHEQKNLPRAGTLSSAKASRHGARAKEFVPTREHAPRRKPPDTAHERKDLPRARRLSSAKASRHGAKAKRFTRARRLSSAKASRHGARAKRFTRARRLSTAKASRHGARAKGFAPRRNTPLGEGIPTRRTSERICPAGVRVRPTCRRTAGRSRPTDCRKNTPSAGSHPRRRGRCRVHSPKKNKTTP